MTEKAQRWPPSSTERKMWKVPVEEEGTPIIFAQCPRSLSLVNSVWRSYVVYYENVAATQRDFNGCLDAAPGFSIPSLFRPLLVLDPVHPLPASFQIKWVSVCATAKEQQNKTAEKARLLPPLIEVFSLAFAFLSFFFIWPARSFVLWFGPLQHPASSCDCLHVSGPRILFLWLLHSGKQCPRKLELQWRSSKIFWVLKSFIDI